MGKCSWSCFKHEGGELYKRDDFKYLASVEVSLLKKSTPAQAYKYTNDKKLAQSRKFLAGKVVLLMIPFSYNIFCKVQAGFYSSYQGKISLNWNFKLKFQFWEPGKIVST